MGAIAKLIGIVIAGIVVIFIAAALFVSLFFDPNDYKDQITAAVENATGRQLTLEGDLSLSVFPNIRIGVGRASLSNAAGFPNVPFASIDEAQLQLALIPLLSKRIEIGEARLFGLELNLARDAQGRNNWQDLSGGSAPSQASAAPEGGGAQLDLGVGAVQIADARVRWSDAAAGGEWVLDNFSLEASDFASGAAFPVEMGFDLAGEQVAVTVNAETVATLELESNTYRLANLDVSIEGSGEGWPGGSGEANVSFDAFVANLNAGTVDLEGLELEVLGMTIHGNLEGRQLFTNLSLQGGIEIDPFDPQDVLEIFDAQIETADSDVLRNASARATFSYTGAAQRMTDMRFVLDDSELTGSVGRVGTALQFDLDVDEINIDRYLPPAAEEETPDEGSIDEVDLPIEPLRNFVASGSLSFGEAKFIGLTFTDASFTLEARNGRMTITPTASLYGGRYSGSIGVATVNNSNAATLTLVQNFAGMSLLPFAQDFLASDMISGTGDLRLNVSATGSNLGEIRRALDGDVSFSFTDGAIEGIDAWYELRRARAVLDGNSAPSRPSGEPRTEFSSIAASGTVEDSILSNNDLNATLPFMTLNGTGTANLINNELNFDLIAKFVDGPAIQADPAMANLVGLEIPLRVTGTVDAPSIRPDFGAAVSQRVQQEAQERVDEKVEEAEDRVRDRLQDRLRGILDR